MNVQCLSCSSRYSVPDAKVQGRKVRIKCKRCGEPILIDGSHLGKAKVGPTDRPSAGASTLPPPSSDPPRRTAEPTAQPVTKSASSVATEPQPPVKSSAAARPAASAAQPKPAPVVTESKHRTVIGMPSVGNVVTAQASAGAPAPKPPPAAAPRRPEPERAPLPPPPPPRVAPNLAPPNVARARVPAAQAAPDYTAPWTVAVTEEDQRELTTDQVVLLYAAGTIDEGTYVWRDGMKDWCSPFEAPELRRALEQARISRREPLDSGEADTFDDSDETVVGSSPLASETRQAAQASSEAGSHPGMWHEPGLASEASFEDVTVSMDERETEGLLRKARRADLGEDPPTAKVRTPFALRAQAGPHTGFEFDEEEVTRAISTTEARAPLNILAPDPTPAFELSQRKEANLGPVRQESPAPAPVEQLALAKTVTYPAARALDPEAPARSPKLDAPGENSVMFSLEALTKKAVPSRPPPRPQADLPGDHRSPGQRAPEGARPHSAPPHAAPPRPPLKPPPDRLQRPAPEPLLEEVTELEPSPRPDFEPAPPIYPMASPAYDDDAPVDLPLRRPARWPWIAAAVVLGAAGASFATHQPLELWAKVHELSAGKFPNWPELAPAATNVVAVAPPAPKTTTPVNEPLAKAPEAAASAAVETSRGSEKRAEARGERGSERPEPTRPATADEPSAEQDATAAAEAPENAEATQADAALEPAEAGLPEFDRSAAAEALGAAAASAPSCKTPDGPTGRGRATVTFSNSGRAVNANVTGAFAGTSVGGCVAKLFQQARVPAFSGAPVKVAKSFNIE